MSLTEEPTNIRSRLLTLVFTDLVDSVRLKAMLGDNEACRLIQQHHKAVRELMAPCGGRKILAAGDGCFITFETPSEAVTFSLNLQDYHRRSPSLPAVRIGIHMGEVTERFSSAGSTRPLDVEGLAVDIASRIQSLAEPAQILLSYPVFDNARQRLDSALWNTPVEWRAHGKYTFQGTDTSLEIYEVGLKGVAPFKPPSVGNKARRDVRADEEETLGWRPAQGLPMPGKPNWVLVKKLGEGGFGDVWLIQHQKTREQTVVKFCYMPDRLRALKREVTLFRLMKESLGTRTDIARVLDYQFDKKPYYLEIEYAGPHTLGSWMEEKGGPLAVPLETRLELVAQVADATGAAHSAGVLHKDIKPSNVMVLESPDGTPSIRMIDFGIGTLEDTRALDGKNITVTGLTEVQSSSDSASFTGTRLFMAPELIEGRPATTKSDIYALGVLLYQVISGKAGQALATGWERDIKDELLREDIAACVDGSPENRLKSAEELSWRLRNLEQRHEKRRAKILALQKEERRRQRAKKLRLTALLSATGTIILLMLIGLFAFLQNQKAKSEAFLRHTAENAKDLAEQQHQNAQEALARAQQARYFASIALAEASIREGRFQKAQDVLLEDPPEDYLRREWGWLLAQTSPEDFALRNRNFFDAKFLPDGRHFIIAGRHVNGPGYLAWYDSDTAEMTTQTFTNNLMVWNAAINLHGTLGATASRETSVTLVDLQSGEVIRKLAGHTGIVRDVAFSPDGKYLASCARDETLRLWGLNDDSLNTTILLPGQSPTEISFSPDSQYIAVATLEGVARVFDVTSATRACDLAGAKERLLSITFTADGKAIATADTSGKTRFYNWPPPPGVREIEPYLSVEASESYPTQVVSTADGSALYVGHDNGTITRLNRETGATELSFVVDQPLWKLSISPDGRRLLTTTRWSVRLIDISKFDQHAEITPARRTYKLAVPDDVQEIEIANIFSQRDQTWRADSQWRTTSGLFLAETSSGDRFLAKSQWVRYSPDGTSYISINPRNQRWQAAETTSSNVLVSGKPRDLCVGAVYSPNGRQVLVMIEKKDAQVFSTATWEPLYTIPRIDTYISAVYTPDSKRLIIADITGLILEVDARSGRQLRELGRRGTGMPFDMALSSDANLLAVGLDQDRAYVVDLQTGDQISTMSGHVRYVHSVQFTPDNERLATLSRDGTVKLWDIQSGRELVTLFNFTGAVVPLGINFDSGGRSITVMSSDKRIVTTEVFPWNLKAYGDSDAPLSQRVETWKRRVRLEQLRIQERSKSAKR